MPEPRMRQVQAECVNKGLTLAGVRIETPETRIKLAYLPVRGVERPFGNPSTGCGCSRASGCRTAAPAKMGALCHRSAHAAACLHPSGRAPDRAAAERR